MDSIHYIFIFYAACTGLNLIMTLGVGNTRTYPKKSKDTGAEAAMVERDEPPNRNPSEPGSSDQEKSESLARKEEREN